MSVSCLAWMLAVRYSSKRWPVLAPVLAALLLGITANEARWAHFEARLAEAARPILGERDSGFICERLTRNFFSSQGYPGHVQFTGDGEPVDNAFLSMKTCARIKDWLNDPDDAEEGAFLGIHIAAHEAEHLAGIRTEAVAECYAIQQGVQMRVRLGADPQTAVEQGNRYYEDYYPRLRADYRSDQCVPGGQLDLTPGDGVWP